MRVHSEEDRKQIHEVIKSINKEWTTWAKIDKMRENHENCTILVPKDLGMYLDNGKFVRLITKRIGKKLNKDITIHIDIAPSLTRDKENWKIACTMETPVITELIEKNLKKLYLASTSMLIKYDRNRPMDTLNNGLNHMTVDTNQSTSETIEQTKKE